MKTSLLFTLALILASFCLSAQTDYRSGYVIMNSGDTLFGEIDYRGDLSMGKLCRFKNSNGEIIEYLPSTLSAYRFSDSKMFISREVENRMVFLEYLINGKVSIYYYRDDTADHYYIDKEGDKLTELPYSEETRMVDNKYLSFKSHEHKGILKYYTQEAPSLQAKIDKMKEPGHDNLIAIAEEYHKTVCKDEECIVYEKPHKALKLNIELVAGAVKYKNDASITDKAYFRGGVIGHFWLPRANEKFYIKTGLLVAAAEVNGELVNKYRIPLHFGYMAPRSFTLRPSFSFAIFSPEYSGGLHYKLNDRINLGIQTWLRYTRKENFPIFPKELSSYSFFGSIYFDF